MPNRLQSSLYTHLSFSARAQAKAWQQPETPLWQHRTILNRDKEVPALNLIQSLTKVEYVTGSRHIFKLVVLMWWRCKLSALLHWADALTQDKQARVWKRACGFIIQTEWFKVADLREVKGCSKLKIWFQLQTHIVKKFGNLGWETPPKKNEKGIEVWKAAPTIDRDELQWENSEALAGKASLRALWGCRCVLVLREKRQKTLKGPSRPSTPSDLLHLLVDLGLL